MELLVLVAVLLFFGTPALALYAAYQSRVLRADIEALRLEVRRNQRAAGTTTEGADATPRPDPTPSPAASPGPEPTTTPEPAPSEPLRTSAEAPSIVWPKSRSAPSEAAARPADIDPEPTVAPDASASGPKQAAPQEESTRSDGPTRQPDPPSTKDAEPQREPPSTKEAEPQPEPAAARLDFETLIGSTWLLRVGLGILAIALALFARSIAPQLPPAAKVALAYAGSIAFFAVGKYFEDRLAKFARPVMAGGLAFGFFVAFAAHFVPAMQAVSFPVSIVWMVFSMLTVLAAAERWQSEPTAILAIVLGNVSALVAAGDADFYSLIMIAFLATTAIVLLLRHEWVALGLAGATISYGTHLLWLLSDRDPIPGDQGFWLNLAFLTSYYVIFLIADVLWWRRAAGREESGSPASERQARALGPTNLVLYVALTTFVYVMSGTGLESIEWYFLTLGAVQGVLAWLYKDANHQDFVFYPVFGTILWTLGMFAAFDALVLNTILAAQALILLLAAHRTGLRVFYGLAQLAMAVAFIHYVVYPPPADVTFPIFIAGIAVASIYLLKASLEEMWYSEGTHGSLWSFLAPAHAVLGGIVIVREALAYFGTEGGLGVFLALTALGLLGLVFLRVRPALLFTLTTVALGGAAYAGALSSFSAWILLSGLIVAASGLVLVVADRFEGPARTWAGWHARTIGALVVVGGFGAAAALAAGPTRYLAWMIIPILLLFFQYTVDERAAKSPADSPKEPKVDDEAPEPRASWSPSTFDILSILMFVAVAGLIVVLTASGVGRVYTAPVWIAFWAGAIIAVSAWRVSHGLFISGYVTLVLGYSTFLFRSVNGTLAFSGLSESTLSSWWAGGFVVLVALVVAVGIDRRIDDFRASLDTTQWWGVLFLTFLPYAMGILLIGAYAGQLLPLGWAYFMPTLVGLVFVWYADRMESPRGVVAVVIATAFWHLHLVFGGVPGSRLAPALLPILLFVIATLALERAVLRWVTPERDHRLRGEALATLVVLATLTAMVAIYESQMFGPTWATAGWSLLGGSMMAAGFALKSALHRRVALVLLGICIVRVFAVDTIGLSDTARIGAFFVLGMILVAIAWLYSRYADELKKLI